MDYIVFFNNFVVVNVLQVRYDDEKKRVVAEPLELTQAFRNFDYSSAWEQTYVYIYFFIIFYRYFNPLTVYLDYPMYTMGFYAFRDHSLIIYLIFPNVVAMENLISQRLLRKMLSLLPN